MNIQNSKRGSALLAVIIAALGACIVLASILSITVSERRLNRSAAFMLEAKYAAEAAVEAGTAELIYRFRNSRNFPTNAFSATRNPLVLPASFGNFFANEVEGNLKSNLVMGNTSYPTDVVAGVVPPGQWSFVSPLVAGNRNSPFLNMNVFQFAVRVYGRAAVKNNISRGYTMAYAMQDLAVVNAPLFANAIFYNLDLEIAPSPPMTIDGTVHSNGNLFVCTSGNLQFMNLTSAVGNIRWGRKVESGRDALTGGDTRPVSFYNGTSNASGVRQISSMQDSANVWIDSNYRDANNVNIWNTTSSNRWRGNVQDASHGVQQQLPVGIQPYAPEDWSTSGTSELRNNAYVLIQPVERKPTPGSPNAAFVDQVEQQKFAYKAGLVIDANVDSSGNGTVSLYTYQRDANDDIIYNTDGTPKTTPLSPTDPIVVSEKYDNPSGDTVNGGMYDHRRQMGVNLIEIDVSQLEQAVSSNDAARWGGSAAQKPQSWWNGVVYVRLPQRGGTLRPDKVNPAIDRWGVKLVNGSKIPNPTFAQAENINGMTLATNAPLYVQGNYNADGTAHTNDSTEPDNANEPPAALAADAINVLSGAWNDAHSKKGKGDRVAASFTEISAAFLTGLVPSGKNGTGNYSGGVENFPRFHESWGNSRTFTYRGSMVALFESEVANQLWSNASYDPPSRDWGYNRRFRDGNFPPGTPENRAFLRVNFRFLTRAEYDAEIAALQSNTQYQ